MKENEFQENDENNSKRITIHINEHNYFPNNTYVSEISSCGISREEYDKIIEEGNEVLYQSYEEKRQYDTIYIPIFIYILCGISIILTISVIFFLYYGPSKGKGKAYSIVSLILTILCIIILLVVTLYNYMAKPKKSKNLSEFINTNLTNYCNQINEKISPYVRFFYDKDINSLICDYRRINPNYRKNL